MRLCPCCARPPAQFLNDETTKDAHMKRAIAALALTAACTSALANNWWDGFTFSGLWAKLNGCTAYCGGNRVN
jgi:hypothetical protein